MNEIHKFIRFIFSLLILSLFAGEQSMPHTTNYDDIKFEAVNITILYDNNPFIQGLQTDWGFSCLVEVGKIRLLFDSGGNGSILLSNMSKLKIDPGSIDCIFLSHYHHDHTGGLNDLLERNSGVTIYYPQSFPNELKNVMKNSGAELVPIASFKELKTNIFSLGELDGPIPEQSLAVRTSKGIVVITGCAHPGIINILKKAKESFPDEVIYLVMGGFHLHTHTKNEINNIISKMSKMGIMKTAPSHCSGDMAREMFRGSFNNNYIEIGTGKEIRIH
jgi:7,8-dihydropterin-6-yl-methyl-4-(beta-D-ribofuranosyl)aminobenzene 5'-phosphate synthase